MILNFSSVTDLILDKDVTKYELHWNRLGQKFSELAINNLGCEPMPYEVGLGFEPNWILETVLLFICGDFVFITQNADDLLKLVDEMDFHEKEDNVFIFEFEDYKSALKYLDNFYDGI